MRELHLFAGAGGGILGGLLLGHTPIGAVEIDSYCQQVLKERQADGSLPEFPIHGDICTFDAKPFHGMVDIVCGGFPCQPWSVAGKRKGKNDERHLWPEFARVIKECRPKFVFAENVSMAAFEQPWRDLREMGYNVPPILCLSAASVGAPHRRKRWWMLAADSMREQLFEQQRRGQRQSGQNSLDFAWNGKKWNVADSNSQGLEGRNCSIVQECAGQEFTGQGRPSTNKWQPLGEPSWWITEPNVGRVANGVAARVDRLRALGNGQVPACAAKAFVILMNSYYYS